MKLHCEWRKLKNDIGGSGSIKTYWEPKEDQFTYIYFYKGKIHAHSWCSDKNDFTSLEEAQHWCELQLAHKFANEICDETIE